MVTVLFNDREEWLAELKEAAGWMGKKLVRLTVRQRTGGPLPTVERWLVGGYISGGQLIRLEEPLGQAFHGMDEEHKIREKTIRAMAELRKACEDLGMEVRGGAYV